MKKFDTKWLCIDLSKLFHVKFNPEFYEMLNDLCQRKGVFLSTYVREAVAEAMMKDLATIAADEKYSKK